MKREMPKIRRTRKLVITERQAVGSPKKEDVVTSMEDDVDGKLKKQIEISKQRLALKYKKDTAVTGSAAGHTTPLKSLDNKMLEDKLQRKRTPRKDVLDPTKGQSTPVNQKNDDPFGFDVLDSPLVFSPVLPSSSASITDGSSTSSLQVSAVVKRRSFGTYDMPITTKPNNITKRRQKNVQELSAMEQWAEQLNAEFDDVENYQLTID